MCKNEEIRCFRSTREAFKSQMAFWCGIYCATIDDKLGNLLLTRFSLACRFMIYDVVTALKTETTFEAWKFQVKSKQNQFFASSIKLHNKTFSIIAEIEESVDVGERNPILRHWYSRKLVISKPSRGRFMGICKGKNIHHNFHPLNSNSHKNFQQIVFRVSIWIFHNLISEKFF